MTDRVRRGLGMLVLAAIAAFVHFAFRTSPGETGVSASIAGTAGVAAAACALWGLVLLALGLLRD